MLLQFSEAITCNGRVDALRSTIKFSSVYYNTHRCAVSSLASPFAPYINADATILYRGHVVSAPDPKLVAAEFRETLESLRQAGVEPVIFAPPPTDGRNLGNCAIRALWFGLQKNACDVAESDYHKRGKEVIGFLNEIDKEYHVIWPSSAMCRRGSCMTVVDGTPLYRDQGHYSREGSRYVGRAMNFYSVIMSNE